MRTSLNSFPLLSLLLGASVYLWFVLLEDAGGGDLDALEGHFELLGIGGEFQRRRLVHVAALDQLVKVLGEVDHSLLVTHADGVGQFAVLTLGNQLAHDGVDDQDLVRGHTRFLQALEQFLSDDGLQVIRQRLADGPMLLGREEVENTVDRRPGAGGVDRAEDKVAGLGGVDRRLRWVRRIQ